ncbi:MAG: hypothetical protein PVJ67_01430 [Candidatus Pacearchaeota archaeon]|jgi:hypothetical protein
MSNSTDGFFDPLRNFDTYPVSKVGKAIRKIYGVEIFRKVLDKDAFRCYIKLHSDGKNYAIIDWTKKRADFKDEGEYKNTIEEILRKLYLI